MSRLVFLDTETTGLNPWHHEVWEIAVITRKVIEHADQPAQTVDEEHIFHVKPDLTKADPNGLRVCRYYERTAELDRAPRACTGEDLRQSYIHNPDYPAGAPRWQDPTPVAMTLARLLDGAHIVGAVPSFDANFLQRFLFRHGQAATWHYHLIDVEALAVGALAGRFTALKRQQITASPGVAVQTFPPYSPQYSPQLPWQSDVLTDVFGVHVPEEDRHTALGDARWARDLYDAVMRGID